MNKSTNSLMRLLNKRTSLISGMISGLCFAPVFFLPATFCIALLTAQIKRSSKRYEAVKLSYNFVFGFYLSSLYWISFALSIDIKQFWWVFPFAFLGLPACMATFFSIASLILWELRNNKNYHFFFCCVWVFIEWIISYIFTGFPWVLIGYALSNSLVLIQSASIFGPLGISFFMVYIASSPYNLFFWGIKEKDFYIRALTSIIMLIFVTTYGFLRLNANPTKYTTFLARLVQPSIPQKVKWSERNFWQNLDKHIQLSKRKGDPNLIVWSEAALTIPYYVDPVLKRILSIFKNDQQVLLTGSVTYHYKKAKTVNDLELYSSLVSIDKNAKKITEYHKAHLVPFGEYIPFKSFLPLKKVTHGFINYTEGKRTSLFVENFNLTIWPLICYEAIFSHEVKISNKLVDVIINITNDTWYGNTSGPYQHFMISRMRTVENGLPMLRVANNGISAFIDPVGRILIQTKLNEVTALDNYLPKKLSNETLYSKHGSYFILVQLSFIFILQLFIKFFFYFLLKVLKWISDTLDKI